jgi:hypothetical protein
MMLRQSFMQWIALALAADRQIRNLMRMSV